MKEIQLKEAKATFSHVVDEAVAGEPTVVTRHGKREAVVISYSDYERLSRVPSLGWLLTNSPLRTAICPREAASLRVPSMIRRSDIVSAGYQRGEPACAFEAQDTRR